MLRTQLCVHHDTVVIVIWVIWSKCASKRTKMRVMENPDDPLTVKKKKENALILLTCCMLGNFSCLCWRLLTFFKITSFKIFFQEHHQSVLKIVWIQIRTDIHSIGSDLVQTVCKDHQSKIKVTVKFHDKQCVIFISTGSINILQYL